MFLDDEIVPPPVQYRRSASHSQQQHEQPCGCGPSAAGHKSLPDLTDVATAETTTTDLASAAVVADPLRRCRRSVSSDSVAGDDGRNGDGDDDDNDDDIFETFCGIPSPYG